MTTSKRAYAAENRAKRVEFLKGKIKELYDRFMADPMGVNFGEEWDNLAKTYAKEKGLLLIAEKEFYAQLKKAKDLKTNM